ncbi:MAG TPA: transcription-repair coupling factor [Pyrinomonadaceae bacterium]|nr:transcription-repair coupling factor [Pyrinomonadaceae bacterium]
MSSSIQQSTTLQQTLQQISETREYQQLLAELRANARIISISGLVAGSARALAVAALQRETGKTFAVVSQTTRDLEPWESDLRFWHGALNHNEAQKPQEAHEAETIQKESLEAGILVLPASETDPYAGISPHAQTLEKRALALWRLHLQKPDFVLLTARALARKTVTPEAIARAGVVLKRDEDHSPEELVEKLFATGYMREDPVAGVGEFSMRGGILDIWPPGREAPVRIEFFGDTIDSLREFDPETQLSTGQLKAVEVPPMREWSVTPMDFQIWSEGARERWSDERYSRSLRDRTAFADEGEAFGGWEWLIGLTTSSTSTVFDHLQDVVLVIDEPSAIESYVGDFYERLNDRYREIDQADDIALTPEELFLNVEQLRELIQTRQRVELRALGRVAAETDLNLQLDAEAPAVQLGRPRGPRVPAFLFPIAETAVEVDWQAQSAMRYHGRIADLAAGVNRAAEEGKTILFVMPSLGVAERIVEILKDYEIESRLALTGEASGGPTTPVVVTVGRVSGGFELPRSRLIVHVESDVFDETATPVDRRGAAADRTSRTEGRRRRSKAAAFLSDFRDLRPGDYVVHIDHGIARFGGLQTLNLGPSSGEFMLLYYADEAKLYVPVERLDLVQRYSSAEGHQPQLDRLGGLGWQKTKAKAKRAMRDMADELLRLYAERKLVGGYAFAADTPWQQEFEDGFPFVLTPDQETAIEDVKKDMEEPVPMDRLLCGDVGYGKTEVAMRAAFKSVMEGKQAAVLTPTTILAYQHYDTFRNRFAPFPVKVELLSRFRTAKEQKEVVKRVESGEVDVIIGTHRMLSKDVRFKDLGLVVVDEEQRFGVAHKERLKQLKKRVDVLTLSATPIPRTLNMSLSGMRDMSLIETAPRDRLAIQTQVVQFSDSVIKSAIDLELSRGGQVFFIHNRVETIETVAALVQRLVPQARLAIGHGQMNEKEMERVMLDFIDYKYDVLVATTIIENGIDIPRANTIIINRADHYGLSQLYQLRGRVGRSNRRAYAYLLIPAEQELTPIARRRLAAIREFSDLGAGFRIAALDLELRGAGSLLGGEQSGHLEALGFDLYTQMLERTVAEMRGEEVEDETSVTLNLGVDVAIPEEYISDMGQRLRTYKRVSSARDEATLQSIRTETEDRYGRIPHPVERLFSYARLRRTAEELGLVSIDKTPDGIAVKFSEKARISPEKLGNFVASREGSVFSPSGVLRLILNEDEQDNVLEFTRDVLLQIKVTD